MKSVDEYIDGLPDEKKDIASYIRELILENVPGVQEKLSYTVPFYHYFGLFMYMNNTKEGIDIGFCRGRDLLEAFPQLELKSRATMATVCVKTKKDIARLEIRQLILSAAAWNEEAKRLNIPLLKKTSKKKK